MEKDKRLSEIDRRMGVQIVVCRKCNMEFNTLHREDIYCPFCQMGGLKNPERRQPRGRE